METRHPNKMSPRPLGVFKRTNPPVFLVSAAIMLIFILAGTAYTRTTGLFFKTLQKTLTTYFSWVFTLATSFFLIFVIWLVFSRFGDVRLGRDTDRPEFGYLSWFAMLFSAGMGIGLVFWSIAEPITHYAAPPFGPGKTLDAAETAMQFTYFHWGLHAWAIYIVVGLALAYFAYRHQLPLTIRSVFYPLLGERIYGAWGHAIDIFAVVGTMFGVATSLGLGVMQVNSGLHYLVGLKETTLHQVVLIAVITAMATASVVLGLTRGIRRLSNFNMGLAVALVGFVLVLGPTLFLVKFFSLNLGNYLQNLVKMSLWNEALTNTEWQAKWTTFYWAWWIAWSPFVGMFIARISRGRTIREFILGALFAPSLATFVWLSVFGGTALHLEIFEGAHLVEAVQANVSTALFKTLAFLPLDYVTAAIATLVVITFFVTSSDSGSLVIDIITAGGDPDPPKNQRIFWAVTEGVIAAVLLVAGGLSALQTAAIVSGFPFSLIMLGMCYCLIKSLRANHTPKDSS